jgi:hypothetical protein
MNTQTIDYQTTAGSTDSCNEPVESERAKNLRQKTTTRNKRKATRSKAPTAASALFSQVESAKIQAAHPSATSTEVFQLLGAKWKTADALTKAQWVAEYVALSDANQADGLAVSLATRRRTAKPVKPPKRRDANEPKRACTPFILFSQVERASVKAEHPTATPAEICKRLGAKWHAADADTKAKFAALYATNKVHADQMRQAFACTKP